MALFSVLNLAPMALVVVVQRKLFQSWIICVDSQLFSRQLFSRQLFSRQLFSRQLFSRHFFPLDSKLSKIAKKSTNKYASRDQEELATDHKMLGKIISPEQSKIKKQRWMTLQRDGSSSSCYSNIERMLSLLSLLSSLSSSSLSSLTLSSSSIVLVFNMAFIDMP